jgi:hypothetical protein
VKIVFVIFMSVLCLNCLLILACWNALSSIPNHFCSCSNFYFFFNFIFLKKKKKNLKLVREPSCHMGKVVKNCVLGWQKIISLKKIIF